MLLSLPSLSQFHPTHASQAELSTSMKGSSPWRRCPHIHKLHWTSLKPIHSVGLKLNAKKKTYDSEQEVWIPAEDFAKIDTRRCPCGGRIYETCCKPYHDGTIIAKDVVTLVKARYSAFVKGEGEYIVNTTHPQYPELLAIGAEKLLEDLRTLFRRMRFTKLDILNVATISENKVGVLFRANYQLTVLSDYKQVVKKKDLFVREGDCWYYNGVLQRYRPKIWFTEKSMRG